MRKGGHQTPGRASATPSSRSSLSLRALVPTLLFFLLVGTAGSCPDGTVEPPPPDSNSGEDFNKDGAMAFFGEVNDTVDADVGDNTDYRYLDVSDRGYLTVRCIFSRSADAGSVALLDPDDEVVREAPVAAGTGEVVFEGVDVLPGRYYVRVRADRGRSDYSLSREFVRRVVLDTTASTDAEHPEVALRLAQLAADPEALLAYDTNGDGVVDETEWQAARDAIYLEVTGMDEAEYLVVISRECERDSDCPGREVCRDYECVRPRRECREDSDCRGDRVCRHDRCVRPEPTAECQGDSDCSGGEVCENERCVEAPPECEGDGDCPGDQVCEDDRCVEPPSEPTTVRAVVVQLRSREAGTTLMLNNCSEADGLAVGRRGDAGGNRVAITTFVGSSTCEAESDAPVGAFSDVNYVTFEVE